MRYDALLFDMDGVLVEGTSTVPAVYREAAGELLRAFGHEDPDDSWSMSLQNPADAAGFREACARWGLPAAPAWGYREGASCDLERARLERGEREPHADTSVLGELAETHRLGVCSNNRHATVADCVAMFAWGDHIDAYRGRFPALAEYDRMKPDPAFLEWVIDELDATRPLFVGDRITDVAAAERAGCDAALLARDGAFPTGTPEPCYRIESLEALTELEASGRRPEADSHS